MLFVRGYEIVHIYAWTFFLGCFQKYTCDFNLVAHGEEIWFSGSFLIGREWSWILANQSELRSREGRVPKSESRTSGSFFSHTFFFVWMRDEKKQYWWFFACNPTLERTVTGWGWTWWCNNDRPKYRTNSLLWTITVVFLCMCEIT